ncbi:Histidine utilization repressor [Janibacter hoylei PVAS-1]|uniref:Histidine utilization repressor n=1 Tax=Janibacter hoylei PVAS-1 TaxID=1210046 RepID=K1E0J7_9MICO|nr:Histidine utilization repressor [Janibacter hoylei PVAS-1]
MSDVVTIDLVDPTPPFEQVRRQLTLLIETGQLVTGERLPSVRQLAGDLGLATGTVARAYRELESAGLVVTRRGGWHPGGRPAELRERGRDVAARGRRPRVPRPGQGPGRGARPRHPGRRDRLAPPLTAPPRRPMDRITRARRWGRCS